MFDETLQQFDAERDVIGSLLLAAHVGGHELASSILDEILVTGLSSETFYLPSHSVIFETCKALLDAGVPSEERLVASELQKRHVHDTTLVHLAELRICTPAFSNAAHLARLVVDAERRRRLDRLGLELQQAARNGGLTEPLRQRVVEALEPSRSASGETGWEPALDLIARVGGEQLAQGPVIGELLYPGRTHVWSGEPESLKSMLALVVCAQQMRAGHSVLWIDLEMNAGDVLDRLRR
ncbi:MAG: DnaB-like helicase N-terminal domain-containing protein [Thermoleophilia bacterium]